MLSGLQSPLDLLDGALGPPEATPALAGPCSPGREVVCVGRGPPRGTSSVACPPRRSPASSWLLGAGPPPRQGHAPPGIPGRELRERPPLQALLQVGGVWLLARLALSPSSPLHLINDFSGRFGETLLAEKLLFSPKGLLLEMGPGAGVVSFPSSTPCVVPGKDMKTPNGSTQRPPTGTTTLTKATSGSLWPGRVTEVPPPPLGLGTELWLAEGGDIFSGMGCSPGTCTPPRLSPAHAHRATVLSPLGCAALNLHLGAGHI